MRTVYEHGDIRVTIERVIGHSYGRAVVETVGGEFAGVKSYLALKTREEYIAYHKQIQDNINKMLELRW